MAPEQLSGQRGHETTATEIYGLGAILYALITRRSPFEADSPAEALARVRDGSPEPPSKRHPGISRDLEVIVLKCLAKERSGDTARPLPWPTICGGISTAS